jgi:DHA1 family tetracycline resistance protein-like MFS transporter
VRKALLFTQFLNGISYGLVFPVAAYLVESMGTGPLRGAAVVTAVLAVHPLARLLSGPLWGALADRLGRVPVLLGGIALAGLGHLVFGLAGSVPLLVVGRALTGLGTGDMVASAAIVADSTSGPARAAGLGQLRASYGLGMLAGPLLGGALALGGLSLPPRVAAALCAVNLLLAWWTVPETRGERPAREPLDLGLLSLPNVRPALFIALAVTLAISMAEAIVTLAIEHVMVPHLTWPRPAPGRERELALGLTVALLMGWGFTAAFVEGWLAGKLVPRLGERFLLRLGLLGWALAFLATPWAYLSGVAAGGVVVVATAAAAGLVSTSLGSLFSRSLPDRAQGSGFGLYQSAAAMGEVAGPVTAGLLFERWFGWPYLAGALLLVLALGVSARLRQVE